MIQVIEYNENNYSDFEWFEGFAVIRFYADWCKPLCSEFSDLCRTGHILC